MTRLRTELYEENNSVKHALKLSVQFAVEEAVIPSTDLDEIIKLNFL